MVAVLEFIDGFGALPLGANFYPADMTAAEFAAHRRLAGLTLDQLAAHLRVNPRTVRSWESGRDAVPDRIAAELGALVDRHRRDARCGVLRGRGGQYPARLHHLPKAGHSQHDRRGTGQHRRRLPGRRPRRHRRGSHRQQGRRHLQGRGHRHRRGCRRPDHVGEQAVRTGDHLPVTRNSA